MKKFHFAFCTYINAAGYHGEQVDSVTLADNYN